MVIRLIQAISLCWPHRAMTLLLYQQNWVLTSHLLHSESNREVIGAYLHLALLICGRPALVVNSMSLLQDRLITLSAAVLMENNNAADLQCLPSSTEQCLACTVLTCLQNQDGDCRQKVFSYPGLDEWKARLRKLIYFL